MLVTFTPITSLESVLSLSWKKNIEEIFTETLTYMPRQRITAGDEFQGIARENRIANDRVCVTMAVNRNN